jgi:hypothetical protein
MKNSIKIKRELFILNFCRKKGWNKNDLKPSQLMIIASDKDYPKI